MTSACAPGTVPDSVSLDFQFVALSLKLKWLISAKLSWIINYNKLITQRTIYCHRGIKLLFFCFLLFFSIRSGLQMRARLPAFPDTNCLRSGSTSNKTEKMANGTHDIAVNFVHLLFSLSLRVVFFFSLSLSVCRSLIASFFLVRCRNGLKHKLTLSNIIYLKRSKAPAPPKLWEAQKICSG